MSEQSAHPACRPRQRGRARPGWHPRAPQAEGHRCPGTELRSWRAQRQPQRYRSRRAGPFGDPTASRVRGGFYGHRSGCVASTCHVSVWGSLSPPRGPHTPTLFAPLRLRTPVGASPRIAHSDLGVNDQGVAIRLHVPSASAHHVLSAKGNRLFGVPTRQCSGLRLLQGKRSREPGSHAGTRPWPSALQATSARGFEDNYTGRVRAREVPGCHGPEPTVSLTGVNEPPRSQGARHPLPRPSVGSLSSWVPSVGEVPLERIARSLLPPRPALAHRPTRRLQRGAHSPGFLCRRTRRGWRCSGHSPWNGTPCHSLLGGPPPHHREHGAAVSSSCT